MFPYFGTNLSGVLKTGFPADLPPSITPAEFACLAIATLEEDLGLVLKMPSTESWLFLEWW